uniref:hypothetical protein n=1 Tax=Jatropha curcas TaxID=180498 RepID=UPI0027994AB7|nr:hypothetical protein QLP06_mgp080 [Jatropha curcas]WFG81159.1 hypothetical protein [Jatropha curcas]
MSEFAPISIYLVISLLVSLILLGLPFPFASQRLSPQIKFFSGIFFTWGVLGSIVALPSFFPESFPVIANVPMNIGGACAIFFLFLADNHFSRLMTLHGFFISTLFLFLKYHIHDVDVAIIFIITFSTSFFLSFGFRSPNEETKESLEFTFIILVTSRFFVAPELIPWELGLVIQLFLLFMLDFEALQEKRRVFFALLLLLMGSCSFCFYGSPGVLRGMNPFIIFLLGSAAAGAIKFLCTTEGGQTLGVFLYLLSNIALGFLLKEEGKTFPEVTIIFIGITLIFILLLYLISLIKGESLSKVLSEAKIMLLKPFFPLLFFLNHAFLSHSGLDLDPWISSMTIQMGSLLFIIFILKKEKKD